MGYIRNGYFFTYFWPSCVVYSVAAFNKKDVYMDTTENKVFMLEQQIAA